MAVVRLTGLLAQEAGARRLEVEGATLGDMLRALPIAGLLLDEHGDLRPLVQAYIDGERAADLGSTVAASAEVILIAAIAGGA